MPEVKSPVQAESPNSVSVLLRIFWMFVGNVTLAVSALFITKHLGGLFSPADIVYLAMIPLLLAARYLDVARYHGGTAYGKPATMADFAKYAVTLVVGAAVVWAAAHGLAYVMPK